MATHPSIFDTSVLIIPLRGAEIEARFNGHIPRSYTDCHVERAGFLSITKMLKMSWHSTSLRIIM